MKSFLYAFGQSLGALALTRGGFCGSFWWWASWRKLNWCQCSIRLGQKLPALWVQSPYWFFYKSLNGWSKLQLVTSWMIAVWSPLLGKLTFSISAGCTGQLVKLCRLFATRCWKEVLVFVAIGCLHFQTTTSLAYREKIVLHFGNECDSSFTMLEEKHNACCYRAVFHR